MEDLAQFAIGFIRRDETHRTEVEDALQEVRCDMSVLGTRLARQERMMADILSEVRSCASIMRELAQDKRARVSQDEEEAAFESCPHVDPSMFNEEEQAHSRMPTPEPELIPEPEIPTPEPEVLPPPPVPIQEEETTPPVPEPEPVSESQEDDEDDEDPNKKTPEERDVQLKKRLLDRAASHAKWRAELEQDTHTLEPRMYTRLELRDSRHAIEKVAAGVTNKIKPELTTLLSMRSPEGRLPMRDGLVRFRMFTFKDKNDIRQQKQRVCGLCAQQIADELMHVRAFKCRTHRFHDTCAAYYMLAMGVQELDACPGELTHIPAKTGQKRVGTRCE